MRQVSYGSGGLVTDDAAFVAWCDEQDRKDAVYRQSVESLTDTTEMGAIDAVIAGMEIGWRQQPLPLPARVPVIDTDLGHGREGDCRGVTP